jgi:hypothetical protein
LHGIVREGEEGKEKERGLLMLVCSELSCVLGWAGWGDWLAASQGAVRLRGSDGD